MLMVEYNITVGGGGAWAPEGLEAGVLVYNLHVSWVESVCGTCWHTYTFWTR